MFKKFAVSWLRHFLKFVDVLKLKLSNTCLFYDSTKRKIQVLHKYEITLVFFVLIWFSNFENQIKTKNTSVISCLWRTCIFRLVEWKNKRVFDSLSFKTSTNFRKCLNHEIANFLDVYQDFPLVGVVFSRAIHWEVSMCFRKEQVLKRKDFQNIL